MLSSRDHRVAVLIDYENVSVSAFGDLLDRAAQGGRVIVKRAYANWASSSTRKGGLAELGIERIQVDSTTRGKNASDIHLAIDAMELLNRGAVDCFVIVTKDGDFLHLVRVLRQTGSYVIGAGPRHEASSLLVGACDEY